MSENLPSTTRRAMRESDSRTNVTNGNTNSHASYSVFNDSSSSQEQDVDEALQFVNNLKRIQKSFQEELHKLETSVKKRSKLDKTRNNEENADDNRPVIMVDRNTQTVCVPREPETEVVRELKRKLAMVTDELEKSRQEAFKRTQGNALRQQMIIEIPDFPMEYYETGYNVARRFNRATKIPASDISEEYLQWVQTRINQFLPEVLNVICNRWSVKCFSQFDYLACRMVSKSWKTILDKFLQNQSQNHNQLSHNRQGWLLAGVSTYIYSNDLSRFKRFVTGLQNKCEKGQRPPQPFPSRDLVLTIWSLQDFHEPMKTLLNLYGEELRCFTIFVGVHWHEFFINPPGTANAWLILRKWVKKMPNLLIFQLNFVDHPIQVEENFMYHNDLTELLTNHPFPYLSQLTTLECRRMPRSVMSSLLRKNPQIENLGIYTLYPTTALEKQETVCWSHYREATKLKTFCGRFDKPSEILSFRNTQWPLETIRLWNFDRCQVPVDLAQLFEVLETFAGTLANIGLEFMATCSKKGLRLTLPKLKTLSLQLTETSREQISYDFLLPLTSLKMLSIYNTGNIRRGMDFQIIELRGWLYRFYNSNIWKLLPTLQKVAVLSWDGDKGEWITRLYVRERLPLN